MAGFGRQRLPERFGRQIALNHEHSACGNPIERIAMTEDVRVGRQYDINVPKLAVETNRLVRKNRVERRRLSLFLRAVLRIGLDVQPEELEGGHGEVLSHRYRAPSADGMDAHRCRTRWEKIH